MLDFISKDFPIRAGIGFLKVGAEELVRELFQWRAKIGHRCKRSDFVGAAPLPTDLLRYTTAPWDRELIVNTQSEWVAYFNNSFQGTDGFGFISYLSQKIGCPGLFILCCSDSPRVANNNMYVGRAIYEFGDDKDDLNVLRTAAVVDDGGSWTYCEEGDLAGFYEINGFYDQDVKKRLGLEYIQEYCRRLGISVFEEGFYTGKGCLIENLSARKWKRRIRDLSMYSQ